jgi:hypothetical protein
MRTRHRARISPNLTGTRRTTRAGSARRNHDFPQYMGCLERELPRARALVAEALPRFLLAAPFPLPHPKKAPMAKTLPLFQRVRSLWERLPSGPKSIRPFVYTFSQISRSDLVARIRDGKHPVVCDSSTFRREDPELVRQVFADASAMILPEVLRELEPLKTDGTAGELCDAVFPNGHIAPQIIVKPHHASFRVLHEYYARLLAERKQVIPRAVDAFIRKQGRNPTVAERTQIVKSTALYGARTAWLARKDDKDGSPQSLVDEDVLAFGVATALKEERDVLILTDDLDLIEQFYKLTSLLRDDIAAHLLTEDYHARPARYLPSMPIPAQLRELTTDPAASFLIVRPQNLDEYFKASMPTVNITVARVRESGECISWCAPLVLAGFLEEKFKTWRNSTRFGNTNVYIQLPLPRSFWQGGEKRCYAFFLADGSGDSVGDCRRISKADVARALFDHEDLDVVAAAASAYQYASILSKAGARTEAFKVASQLLRFTRGVDGHRITALGHAQAAFAAAAYQEHVDPTEALDSCESVDVAFGHARAPDLRGLALSSRLTHARARAHTGDMRAAIEEWGALELSCAWDRDPYISLIGRAAGCNRALNYWFIDPEGALSAIERFLVHLGWPPIDPQMYEIALYGFALRLLERGNVRCMLSRSAELLRFARQTARIDWKLVGFEGYASIVALAAARGHKDVASAMLSDLVAGIARESFPMAALGRTVQLLKAVAQPIQLGDLLMMKTILAVGPRCHCCSVAEWARGDCMMAKLHLNTSGPGVGVFLLRRVLRTYELLAAADELIVDVVRECNREIKIATTSDATPISAPPRSTHTSLDQLDLVVMVPEKLGYSKPLHGPT